jgi:NAD(P)-dependent dehydrogenase (short-subunit alcohol dehydrogenase family)
MELARLGARVGVLDVDGDGARATAEAIVADGGDALALAADVTARAEVEAAVGQVVERWGGLDAVVSNAGLVNDGSLLADTDDDEWRRMLAVNLDGALHVCRAALPWLKQSRAGRVVIISSTWGQRPAGHSYSYMVAKGGLLAFAKSLALELAPFGVLVNAVAPGSVRTRMIPDPERELREYPIPIGRIGEPEEISSVVAFLVGDGASFLTGQTISVNGGQTIVGI